jgi:hypothetical protein
MNQYQTLLRLRRQARQARADRRTPEQIAEDTERRMAEPVEVTLAKAQKQLAHRIDEPGLTAKLMVEYAQARIWHIKTGRPLPRFSNGNYKPSWAPTQMRLIDEGNRQLLAAWKAGLEGYGYEC